ncbi:MAG TPA: SDR family NAD(P)-dependent oxidoreductase, partial [Thermoleophilaceae bacterium]|nr:SDR family NAD(P)-dependent oxidoreductase [Thermoleophilaceae bacterium]
MSRLEGKVAVITGTASGIGAEMARVFRENGATVVGVDLNEGDAGDLNIRADVTDEQQVAGMYGRTKQEFGRVDVIVNNAGINPPEDMSVLDTPVET